MQNYFDPQFDNVIFVMMQKSIKMKTKDEKSAFVAENNIVPLMFPPLVQMNYCSLNISSTTPNESFFHSNV